MYTYYCLIKIKNQMKKLFLLTGIFALVNTALNAQVAIGANQEPNPDAVLELITTTKGFLPPRVTLKNPHDPSPLVHHVEGMIVYNTYNNNADTLIAGLYMNNGTQWIALRQAPYLMPNWFYMPSFPIDVSSTGSFTIDLWDVYKNQFDNKTQTGGISIKSDPNAPRLQPWINSGDDLYYYVVGHDASVFSNVAVSPNGILSYDIDATGLANKSDSTYMNIVLVIK